MAGPLRIVIVSYVDDNFGDNLIRISAQALLEVALAQHGVAREDYVIAPMALKSVDEELVAAADVIFFGGGGLFGVSYLGFFPHLDQITKIAEQRGIPVIFSSMGINNMGDEGGRAEAVATILSRRCVKALTVRENLTLFRGIAAGLPLEVSQVADPAVWTKYVYGMTDVVPDGTLGINVVRGGLFAANQRRWGLTAEMTYLDGLRSCAAEAGLETVLYTNGSLTDNNTLRYYVQENKVPTEQVLLPQTTREVVEAIAPRSRIASIRMHSSIIAYSFQIPTVGLAWNDKLPFFYEAIGHPDRLLAFEQWDAEEAFGRLRATAAAPESGPHDSDYLMSTYSSLHAAVGEHVLGGRADTVAVPGFAVVADALVQRADEIDDDAFDLRVKVGKAERAYLGQFVTRRANDQTIREQTKQIAGLRRSVTALERRVTDRDGRLRQREERISELEQQVRGLRRELDLRFTTRVRRFLRRRLRTVRQRIARHRRD